MATSLPGENLDIRIEDEIRRSYLDYAMSVIIGRALPDVRDGLKPVHRRILFAMRELRNDHDKPYKKSARVVGDVIGKYHPHGDSAVYDALVRMAQDFSMRYPLVDGQGNFGSVDGDPPAAMRYTEVRMTRLTGEMLADIDKETVDFTTNYDGSMEEPVVLPAKVPALLINGSSGIAVGMATNIPPHNLSEIVDATVALIDNPEITLPELMTHVPGPDLPTAGFIYGRSGIAEAYATGRGIIKMRARAIVERGHGGRESIVVTELPFQVNKSKLIEKIAELIKAKRLDSISEVRDESDREGLRLVLFLKKDEVAQAVLNQLYKFTQMEATFGIIMLAISDSRPVVLGLKAVLSHYIRHRREIVRRRTQYELRKAEERAHILEGLKIALENLDEVIALIKASASPPEARQGLMERFGLSVIQAQAILEMRLQRLTALERDKLLEEYRNLLKAIAGYKEMLASERRILGVIKEELAEMKVLYGDERRTEILEATGEINLEDMIAEEEMVVTVTHGGYIKRNSSNLYRAQRRGGKGRMGMETKEEDFVEHLFVASTHSYFLFFTNQGRVYWRKVHEIPQGGRMSRGKAIVNLLSLEPGERVATILPVRQFDEGRRVLMATRKGVVKKSDLMEFSRPRMAGIRALVIDEDDELIAARLTFGNQDVILSSRQGKAIRFDEQDLRDMGRIARGVIGMRLAADDAVVGVDIVSGGALLSVTSNGYGKRTRLDEYRVTGRGGMGIITIKTGGRNGDVVGVLQVADDDEVLLMTDRGRIIRMEVKDIPVVGRNTLGVTLMDMEEPEHVVGIVKLAEKE
ncbi:MAG: DNA gyrase subunit A [Pseudomonadota bacterium]